MSLVAFTAATSTPALTPRALAHPAPAEAPDFAKPECVTVVDKSAQPVLSIAYSVMFDDTAFGQADIPLFDAKTYQFFAFAAAVFPDAVSYRAYPFAPAGAQTVELPFWITGDDIKRAAQASGSIDGAAFSLSDVPVGAVLADNVALKGSWLRITDDEARVPITSAQAQHGVQWNLSDVAPGAYTVAAYIFSPPYNGWAVRPGVVKVVDAAHDVPAGQIDSAKEFVFSYQGRRVSACLDVPEGTRLDAYFRIEERPEAGWMPWVQGRDVSSGALELCFHDAKPALTGSVRLRFDLTVPDGESTTLYSPDTMTVLDGSGPCVASDTLCCDFPGATMPAPSCGDAGSSGPCNAPAEPDAAKARVNAGRRGTDAGVASQRAAHRGCSAVRSSTGSPRPPAWLLVVVVLLGARHRRFTLLL